MSDDPIGYCVCLHGNKRKSACGSCPRHRTGQPKKRNAWQRNDPRGDPPPFETTMRAIEVGYEQRVKGDPK